MTTIRFDTDKNQKRIAYKWLQRAARWVRMNLEEARLLESTESADVVYYGPNCWKPGTFEFSTVYESEKMSIIWITQTA